MKDNSSQFNYWIKFFDKNIIENIRKELSKIFELSGEDLKDEETVNNIISTCGFNSALHKAIDKENFSKDFFSWYDNLQWYDSDDFDGLIQDKILKEW